MLMNVIDRVQAPTPKFFRILRTIGIAFASAGGALLVAPAVLPAGILAIAGYLTVAGTVMTAVSQAAVDQPLSDPAPGNEAVEYTLKKDVYAAP